MAHLTQAHEARVALGDQCRGVTEDEEDTLCGTRVLCPQRRGEDAREPVNSHVWHLMSVVARTVRCSGSDHVSGRFESDKIKTGNPGGFHRRAVGGVSEPRGPGELLGAVSHVSPHL